MSSLEIAERIMEAEERSELLSALVSLVRRPEIDELARILSELHNTRRINLVSDANLSAIASLERHEFWSAVNLINDTIPTLDCSHRELLSLVSTLVKAAGNDGAAGQPNLALLSWSRDHPEGARRIVDGIMKQEPLSLAHGLFAVLGLDDEAIAFDLMASAHLKVFALGLRSIARLETVTIGSMKKAVDAAYDALENQFGEDARASAIEAAFCLWEKLGPTDPYRQDEIINAIGMHGDAKELSIMSAMLFFHNKGLPKESVQLILEWLGKTPSNSGATLQNLDHAVRSEDDRWEFEQVVAVFEYCVPTLESKPEGREYHSFSQWAWGDTKYTSYLFSRWLCAGQFDLCSYLSALLQGVSGTPTVEIQRSHLPSNEEDQIFMARKAVGFLWHHEVTTASILLSIVKNGKLGAREDAEALLFNPLLLSYGGELRDYLESQRTCRSKRVADCVKRLLQKHDAHMEGLKTPEALVELMPSAEQRRTSAMKDFERNQEIQKQARARSIFADLVTHQTLLYGRKSFSIVHGREGEKHPNVSALSEFSYSAELPRLSVIDPVGFNELISIFRVMKRRQG